MRDYYTYCYLREDGTPYYIGSGRGKRIKGPHLCEVPPVERRLKLKQNLTQEESWRHETYLIDVLGCEVDGGLLTNLQTGGRGSGFKHHPSTIKKMSETTKLQDISHLQSPEVRKKRGQTYTRKSRDWFEFTDPQGMKHKLFTSIREFSDKIGVQREGFYNVLRGKVKHHKGWSVCRVSPDS